MVWTPSEDFIYSDVIETRGACGVVKRAGSNEDLLQLQSESTPNPQNLKLLTADCCTRMISFAWKLHTASEYVV